MKIKLLIAFLSILGAATNISSPNKPGDNLAYGKLVYQIKDIEISPNSTFCPSNPNLILSEKVIIDIKNNKVIRIKDAHLYGWIDDFLLISDIPSGPLRIIDPLNPDKKVFKILIDFYRNPLGKDNVEIRNLLNITMNLSKKDVLEVPKGKMEINQTYSKTFRHGAPINTIYDDQGNEIYKSKRRIHTFRKSPDGYRYLIYNGAEHFIYDTILKKTIKLPIQNKQCHREVFGFCFADYYWTPDSSTLIIEVDAADHQGSPIEFKLYLYSTLTRELYKIVMPEKIADKYRFNSFGYIADISNDLKILFATGHVVKIQFNNKQKKKDSEPKKGSGSPRK